MTGVPTLNVHASAEAVPYDLFCLADLRIGRVLYTAPVQGSRQNLCQLTIEVAGWGLGSP